MRRLSRTLARAALLTVPLLAACRDDPGPTAPDPTVVRWPVVYDLAALPSSTLGTIYREPVPCNQVRRSAIEAGQIRFHRDGSAEVYLRAWRAEHASPDLCDQLAQRDKSQTVIGRHAIGGTERRVTITFNGAVFATAPLPASGFPDSLEASIAAPELFGLGLPFSAMRGETRWAVRP